MAQVRGNRFRGKAVTLVIISALLIFFHHVGVLQPVENVIFMVLKPAQRFFYSLPVEWKNFGEEGTENPSADTVNNLLLENTHLRTRVEELQARLELQDAAKAGQYDAVPVRVISMSSDQTAKIMIIDQGSQAGVKQGNAVISPQGALLGQVIQVTDTLARVALIIDNSSAVAARVQNDFNSPGVVYGQKGLSLQLDLVPQNEQMGPGQMVITSGLEGSIPRGLVIGQVDEILSDSSDLFQSASLRSLVKFDRLDVVGVIKN